jgi:hypothetical protein
MKSERVVVWEKGGVSQNAGFLRQSGIPADTINQREAAVSKSHLTNQRLMLEKLMSN